MKKVILLMVVSLLLANTSQDEDRIFYDDFVECFYSKKTNEPMQIYDGPGGELVAELKQPEEKYCWYRLAIDESKDGWLKIMDLKAIPGCRKQELEKDFSLYKGKWVVAKNMKINLPDITKESGIRMNFYEEPDKNSTVVYTAFTYLSVDLLAVDGDWAKVTFTNKLGENYEGWLERKYQCAAPWTTCPVYD